MAKAKKQQHFVNGIISGFRDSAAPADTDLVKKAIKESKKNKNFKTTVFSGLTKTGAKKLLAI